MKKRPKARRDIPTRPEPARRFRRSRDPITTFALFGQLMALGLVAAALFLDFPNEIRDPASHLPYTYDKMPTQSLQASFFFVHTRASWVALAVLGLVVTNFWYRHRESLQRHVVVQYAPVVVFLMVGLHAAAQWHLQAQGAIKIESHGPVPSFLTHAMEDLPVEITTSAPATAASAPASASAPATRPGLSAAALSSIRVEGITRYSVLEGIPKQWNFLFSGDAIFAAPIFFAWLFSFAPRILKPKAT